MMFDRGMEKRFRSAVAVGSSLFLSLAVLLAAEELIRSKLRPFFGFAGPGSGRTVRYVLFGAAAMAVLAIMRIRRTAFRTRHEDDPAGSPSGLARTSLLVMALAVIPALLGFTLFLLFGLNIDFYILMFVSIFLVFMFFPRRSVWADMVRSR